jgi:hypothetical protein
MIDALISGKLFAKPVPHTGKSGKPFATCKVRASTGGEESIFVSAIAFEPKVIAALLALEAGDSVSLSGALTPKVWEGKPALDRVAHGILTAYPVSRKRKAVAPEPEPGGPQYERDYAQDSGGF